MIIKNTEKENRLIFRREKRLFSVAFLIIMVTHFFSVLQCLLVSFFRENDFLQCKTVNLVGVA